VSTFTLRLETSGDGIRLAVKDLIDMAGLPTTAAGRAVAETAVPADADAPCLAGARAAGARIVGRANLHELALGTTGVNAWTGTPVNPVDPARAPGGSSSGCAVAVADGDADVAFGTDTGGSVRIPSAYCGTAGLKTTWGRIPLQGVWPLAPSFDTVGPMARDMAGVIEGMALLEPGFLPAGEVGRVGRLRIPADPLIDAAVDRLLATVGWEVADVEIPEWDDASVLGGALLITEAWINHRRILESHRDLVSDDTAERLALGRDLPPDVVDGGRGTQARLAERFRVLFAEVDLVALPTVGSFAPLLTEPEDIGIISTLLPANVAGVPALALPVPTTGPLPASLQLMGPRLGEELLCAAGIVAEAAARTLG
jgi:amidase